MRGLIAAGMLAVSAATAPLGGAVAQGRCHESYVGWCVPVDVEDVDCLGGTGNGPFYVGRVRVVGPDEYFLDTDFDGIGCETSPIGPLWRG
jgi:hypothetical protein